MINIQVFNNISSRGLDLFQNTNYTINTDHSNPDAILLRSQNLHNMAINHNLKAIARAGAGTNNIPLEQLSLTGIPVFNTPGANANAVKELVIAAMLIASRKLCASWAHSLKLNGDDVEQQVEKIKKEYTGSELPSKTLGIIGLGAIGVQVANAAIALGMQVIGYDPQITIRNAWQLSAQVTKADSLQQVLKNSDFITVHIPYLPATHHLLGADELTQFKPQAILLNFARGKIVDETAVIKRLQAKQLGLYVTDFPTKNLLATPNTLCFPHLGASTLEAEENCAVMAANTLRKFIEFGTIENSVNFPALDLAYNGGYRLAITNSNIPNMVGQISSILAEEKLNIIDMINRSRDKLAYTLIDVDQKINGVLLNRINDINGVLNTRVIDFME